MLFRKPQATLAPAYPRDRRRGYLVRVFSVFWSDLPLWVVIGLLFWRTEYLTAQLDARPPAPVVTKAIQLSPDPQACLAWWTGTTDLSEIRRKLCK